MARSDVLPPQLEETFRQARNRAFFRKILSLILQRPNELVAFGEVQRALRLSCSRNRGVQPVEIDKIVGSVDRYDDFDRHFLPTQDHTKERWKRLYHAYRESVALPPVVLYKVGDAYFVQDGHHRISVARAQDVKFIDAEVTECTTRVPITADLKPEDVVLKGEYSNFLARTGLDPAYGIEFSLPGRYELLSQHILVYRCHLSLQEDSELSIEEAAERWYQDIYRPVVEVIREQNTLQDFPNRTEADLYLWIVNHRQHLLENYGQDVDLKEAATDFAEHFGKGL